MQQRKTQKKDEKEKKDTNRLYKLLRCGMLHSFMPQEGVVLNDMQNNLEKNVVGARDLYNDLKKAWAELNGIEDILHYMENKNAIQTWGTNSGNTIDNKEINE